MTDVILTDEEALIQIGTIPTKIWEQLSDVDSKALGMALQALEKQIPKKPRKTDSYRGVLKRVYAYVCPTCGNACLEKYMNERQNTMFCWNCGQKLDWSEENE